MCNRLLLVASLLSACLARAEQPTVENLLGMRFSVLPPATFQMGTTDIGAARFEYPEPDLADIADETPAHPVTLRRPTLMAQTEVTQEQWWRVMQNRPGPAEHWQRDDWAQLPVVGVDWFMAVRFTEELDRLDPQYAYRLPTEAEWEYAARAGSSELRPVPSAELEDHAWYIHNSGDQPQPVASRQPNAFGLYDMLGNAWEWVSDYYAPDTYYLRSSGRVPAIDPDGPGGGGLRVRRGGSYHCPLHLVRPGYRTADDPGTRYSVLGFRLVALTQQP